jgi:hypothetical protein
MRAAEVGLGEEAKSGSPGAGDRRSEEDGQEDEAGGALKGSGDDDQGCRSNEWGASEAPHYDSLAPMEGSDATQRLRMDLDCARAASASGKIPVPSQLPEVLGKLSEMLDQQGVSSSNPLAATARRGAKTLMSRLEKRGPGDMCPDT